MTRCGIIPAAGRGTRFGELSSRYPKCTLPYKNKPIIIHNIEWLLNHGCDEINIVVNYGKERIKSIVEFYNFDCVRFIDYDVDDGVAGSVLAGAKNTECDSLLIILSDMVTDFRFSDTQLEIPFLSTERVEHTGRWCCYDGVTGTFYDKDPSSPSHMALTGIYNIPSRKCFVSSGNSVSTDPHLTGEFQLSEILDRHNHQYHKKFISMSHVYVRDFGTLHLFLKNRELDCGRAFNNLEFNDTTGTVTKRSEQLEKMYREYAWFQNAPISMQRRLPKVYNYLGDLLCTSGYVMERVNLPTIRDLFVYLDNSKELWDRISDDALKLLGEFEQCSTKISAVSYWDSVYSKTQSRLRDVKNIPEEFLSKFRDELDLISEFDLLTFYHGDLCFSNMFYDEGTGNIKLIDPRGEYYGSFLYDLAKLNHSFAGLYDIVDTEMYITDGKIARLYSRDKSMILGRWNDKLLDKYGLETWKFVQLLTASLFYSMIPLHYHNPINQKIYKKIGDSFWNLYNSDRIYNIFDNEDLYINLED